MIREIKKLGGLDTVGVECGDGISKRLRSELGQIVDPRRLERLLKISLEVNDADQPWWTAMTSNEKTPEQQERVREFLTFARYTDSKLPVFVGHSLFFKAFYSKRISNELLLNRQSLSENLKNFRLSNASMLAVTVKFVEVENGQSDAMIIDADLIFGGGFHGVPEDGHHHHNGENGEESKSAGSSYRSNFFDSPLKLASSLETSGQSIQQVFNSINSKEFHSNLQHELKQKKEAITKGVKKLSEKIYDFFDA